MTIQEAGGVGSEAGRTNRVPTVVVTRPCDEASELVRTLESDGYRVLLCPTIEISPPSDPRPLQDALARISQFDWIMFTSANGVRAAQTLMSGARAPSGPFIAAVGPATARAVEAMGWEASILPREFSAEGLLRALDDRAVDLTDKGVLLPQSAQARPVLAAGLRDRGARVTAVEAYRGVGVDSSALDEAREALASGEVDLVTFTAPSIVRRYSTLLGDLAPSVPAVAIGPVTARAARESGYRVEAVARSQTTAGLVEAVRNVLPPVRASQTEDRT